MKRVKRVPKFQPKRKRQSSYPQFHPKICYNKSYDKEDCHSFFNYGIFSVF